MWPHRFTASQYSIRLGEYNLKAPDAGESEVFRVTEIKTHPSFSGVGFYNDVALFRMDHDARYTEYVQPVCLPSGGQRGQSFVGDTPTIIGWGTTRYGRRPSFVIVLHFLSRSFHRLPRCARIWLPLFLYCVSPPVDPIFWHRPISDFVTRLHRIIMARNRLLMTRSVS